jgi:hypothetical protein
MASSTVFEQVITTTGTWWVPQRSDELTPTVARTGRMGNFCDCAADLFDSEGEKTDEFELSFPALPRRPRGMQARTLGCGKVD